MTLTAALKAGDGTVGTATGILHVDNVKPVIASFTVGGGTSATITAGKTIPLTATFTGGTGTITASVGGSVTITSGASVLVAPDIATTYSLRIVSRSGVAVATGAAGQPGNVTIGVTGAVTRSSAQAMAPLNTAMLVVTIRPKDRNCARIVPRLQLLWLTLGKV